MCNKWIIFHARENPYRNVHGINMKMMFKKPTTYELRLRHDSTILFNKRIRMWHDTWQRFLYHSTSSSILSFHSHECSAYNTYTYTLHTEQKLVNEMFPTSKIRSRSIARKFLRSQHLYCKYVKLLQKNIYVQLYIETCWRCA